MPTRRFGKVSWWLKHGEAHVIHRTPFTIRMDRDTTSYADLITVGADAGGGHVGIFASSAKREYIRIDVELRQDVKNILVLRNAFEKTRKQIKVNALSINALSDNLNFPMFAKLTLKKT